MEILRTDYNPRGASVVIRDPLASGHGYDYMQVYHHLNDYDEWSFRRMRHENDALADWISPDRVSWYFTGEVEEKAKKACLKAERLMAKARREFKKTELYAQMEREVNRTVTSYRDDFFMHDCTRIGLWILEGEIKPFRWYIRESGTWIMTGEVEEGEAQIIKQKDHRIFHYAGKLVEQTRSTAIYEPKPWYVL